MSFIDIHTHILPCIDDGAKTKEEAVALLEQEKANGVEFVVCTPHFYTDYSDFDEHIKRVKETYPNKNIWAFTGFTLEQLQTKEPHPRCEATDELLSLIDILVDGRFEKDKKNLMLKFRGSENQRIIDLPQTLASGEITLWDKIDKR